MEKGGTRYYVACDQIGSPRMISTGSGTIVGQIDYDSFGRVILDTNPAFGLPIGFAGGLTDTATGLVHFGFRDYDPAGGRWTARDPMLFGGRQANMFAYARNNPVALRDPSGLAVCVGFSAYAIYGAGFQVCVGGDGLSVCEETGFGFGGGLQFGAGNLARPGNDIGLDLSAGCGPASFSYNATLDHCGDFKHGAKGKVGAGPFSATLDQDGNVKFGATVKGEGWSASVDSSGRVGGSLDVSGPGGLKGFEGKCKISGKLAGTLCQRF
jgi:RHS repeat-associated protein